MEPAPDNQKQYSNSSLQTVFTSNEGKAIDPIDPSKIFELFEAFNDTPK